MEVKIEIEGKIATYYTEIEPDLELLKTIFPNAKIEINKNG